MILEESREASRRLVLGGLGVIGILYFVVFVIPMIFMVAVSLGAAKLGIAHEMSNPFSAYQRFWGDPYYREIVWRTLRLALTVVTVTMAVGVPLAYLAVRGSRSFRAVTLIAVLNPLFVSVIIRTYGLKELLAWANIEGGFTAVLVGSVQVLLPFMVIPLMNGFREIDPLIVHSAKTLGAGGVRIATRIILPVLAPSLVAGGALVFILCFNIFSIPLILGNPAQPTLGLQVYMSGLYSADFTFAASIAMTMLAVAMLVLTGQNRLARGTGRAVL